MGACPSDLAGPECGGPPPSTDDLKEKQAKVRDAGVKARTAKSALESAKNKLKALEDELASIVEQLNLADVRISDKEVKAAAAKPAAKAEADRQVAIAKAEKNRLDARKKALESPAGPKQKAEDLVKKLETESTVADTELATAQSELDADLKSATPTPLTKKITEDETTTLQTQIKAQITEFKQISDKIDAITKEAGELLTKLGPSVRRPRSKTVSEIVDDMAIEEDKFKEYRSTILDVSSKLALSSTSPLTIKELALLLKDGKDALVNGNAILPILEAKLAKIKAIDAYDVSGTSSATPPPLPLSGPTLDPTTLSIASIDKYLTDKYSPIAAVDNVVVKSTIGRTPPFDRFNKYIFGNYETLNTGDGGGRNDCLIHAILGGVSSVFRKLTNAQKNESGDYFRRTVLPKTSLYAGKPVDIARLTGLGFLGNEDVGYIKDVLKISIFSFESAVSGVMGTPGSADFFSTGVSDVYMIFNPDNAHYETVRVNGTSSYTIPIVDTATDIKKVVMEGNIKASYAGITDPAAFGSFTTEGFAFPAGMTDVNQLKREIDNEIEAAKRRLIIGGPAAPVPAPVAPVPAPPPPPPPPPITRGRRITYRKRKGGNDPVKSETQQETTARELSALQPKPMESPKVRTTAAMLVSTDAPKTLPKGGRRRTFRKKKKIQQIEKQLESIKKSLTDIIKE